MDIGHSGSHKCRMANGSLIRFKIKIRLLCHTSPQFGFIKYKWLPSSPWKAQKNIYHKQMLSILKPAKNLDLAEESFNELVRQLQRGNELLFERLFTSFFKRNLEILKRNYQAQHEDAYDSVMWAMLRMRQLLIENKVAYGNLDNYFTRMAVTRYIKSQTRKKEFATEKLPELNIGEEHFADKETLAVLNKAWAKLGPACSQLLKGFYYDKIELKQLTEMFHDSSHANTRKRKERCLKKLRQLFFDLY